MSGDWVVIVAEGQNIWNSKVYGPFASEEVARALASGMTTASANGGNMRNGIAVRMEKP